MNVEEDFVDVREQGGVCERVREISFDNLNRRRD